MICKTVERRCRIGEVREIGGEDREIGDAPQEEGHAQERLRQEGHEPQTGHRHRAQRGEEERRQGAAEIGAQDARPGRPDRASARRADRCPPAAAPPSATPSSGLGHIAQVAVLPAFAHATRNSRLTALVSDDRGQAQGAVEKVPDRRHVLVRRLRPVPRSGGRRLHRPAELAARRVHRFARPRPACTCCARSRWRSPLTSVSG